jgi:hypothetical protein
VKNAHQKIAALLSMKTLEICIKQRYPGGSLSRCYAGFWKKYTLATKEMTRADKAQSPGDAHLSTVTGQT